MTELTITTAAKRDADGKIAVADPFSPDTYHADADSIIRSMFNRRDQLTAAFNSLGEIDAAPLEAVKAVRREMEDADEALKDYGKTIRDALLALSGFDRVITQMQGAKTRIDPASVRGRIAELVKVLKAREDAEKIAAPKHTYFYAVTATDAEHGKLQSAMKKVDPAFAFVSPQKDAEWKTAAKLFSIKQ